MPAYAGMTQQERTPRPGGFFLHLHARLGALPSMTPHTITQIAFWPIDVPIRDPFVVATGTRLVAENVIVRITFQGGACGYGEMAPFPEVGGEDRESCLSVVQQLGKSLLGQSASDHTRLAKMLREMAPIHPAVRCGLETAILDAFCRSTAIPLWSLWGGSDVRAHETDITIPISDLERTVVLAAGWYGKGFRLFKMKIGKDVDQDVRRLEAVHRALPGISFIGDGNQGFSREECLTFVKGVKSFGGALVLLEQPVERDDLESMAVLRRETGIPIAADEAVRSLEDAAIVIRQKAADFINIKIMKTGVWEAVEIARLTQASGLRLMIGGMVETRVAMGCSFAMVLGLGGFEVLDLDTPLLLSDDPVSGGYRYAGPMLQPWNGLGLDLTVSPPNDLILIE